MYVLVVLTAITAALAAWWPSAFNVAPLFTSESLCPAPSYVAPMDHNHTQHILHNEEFRNFAIERFARALRIDTTVEDTATEDDFTKFQIFHDYLAESFPLAHSAAEVSHINKWSLVFEFIGSDPTLKPVLFMAHQDTVPFGDLTTWETDPLGGVVDYEEGKVYGRGANDVKNLLVGLLGAMEELLVQNDGQLPLKRTVILAFGHDEEISGNMGAHHVAQYILKKYGPKSIDHIMDEGAPMFLGLKEMGLGLVITAEKGYLDVEVEVSAPGGHSSNPNPRTSIGILGEILASYEKEQYVSQLGGENPFLQTLECVGEHADIVPYVLRRVSRLVRQNSIVNYIARKFISSKAILKYIVQTSQAVDIVRGGDKVNALPRVANAYINHRITIGDDKRVIMDKVQRHAEMVAKAQNLGLEVDGVVVLPPSPNGNVKVRPFGKDTPTSPVTAFNDRTWNVLAGHMKTFYETEVYPERFVDGTHKYVIAPSSMQGNTDTRHYWDVTDHIYRSQPGRTNLFTANMHGSNEWVHVETHLQVIGFYYNYVRNLCF